MNQVILVGRLTHNPEVRVLEDGRKVTEITLAVTRPYKSAETSEYETDFIRCTLWQGIAENTEMYCQKGSVIGVKARIGIKRHQINEEKSFSYPEIIAERITFISAKKDD